MKGAAEAATAAAAKTASGCLGREGVRFSTAEQYSSARGEGAKAKMGLESGKLEEKGVLQDGMGGALVIGGLDPAG